MFKDSIQMTLSSGKGGQGCVAFRTEKFVVKGGPNGGDGGRGGDIFFKVDNNTHALSHFQTKQHIKAENGKPGLGSRMTGKTGEKMYVIVPPGTQVIDADSGEILLDLVENGYEVKFLQGGKGGMGNFHFKSSTNQRPTYAQPGEAGVTKEVRLELKLIADVGLVGFPNVGKSTLISTISNATPEVANYEFTTLTPKLGQVNIGEYDSFVMADIPGIIGGAHEGKGLGLKFLRHIERTKTLLFMIDLASYRELDFQYLTLKDELVKFSEKLSKRKYAIALTRVDAMALEEVNEKVESFIKMLNLEPSKNSQFGFDKSKSFFEQNLKDESSDVDYSKPFFIAPISSVMHTNIDALKFALYNLVKIDR